MIRLHPTALLASTFSFVACASLARVERAFVPAEDVRGRDLSEALGLETGSDAYLKGHMIDGRVYLVQAQTMDTSGDRLVGEGMLLGVNRDTLYSGRVSVPLDSVVLFETNTLVSSGASQALSVVTGV